MLDALGKLSTQALFVTPERVGNSDPMVPNNESVGSGPFRFLRGEWVPGSHAAFERFDRYVPRDEPADGAAGGKREIAEAVYGLRMPKPEVVTWTLGRLIVWSNDVLVELLGDGFHDLAHASEFLSSRWTDRANA